MGAEEQAPPNGIATVKPTAEAAVATGDAPPPAVPPPEEEPPKIEEIVTPDVLEHIIKGYNPELSLVSWKAELGSKVGDNYMSILYAVELELEDKQKNGAKETLKVMLKTLPRNVYRADMISEMKAFKIEANVYQNIHSLLIEIQEEKGVPKEDMFRSWPVCYAAHLDGRSDYLAMEDLKVSGYRMASRVIGLDFNHCSSVLKSLAKYHAISFAKYGGSRDKILEDFPMLTSNMFDKNNKSSDMNQQFFTQSYKCLADGLKEMGEELASSRMTKIAEADVCTVMGGLTTNNIENAVILHGDCWINNIMFKYDENDTKFAFPTGIKFIDFQLSLATSRLVDVYYFLINSCKLEILNEREDDLLMIYFAEFTSFAERLGVNTKEKGLTWENFLKEASRYKLYGIFMGLLLAPMFGADSEDIPDMESFTQEDYENSEETVKKFYKDLKSGGKVMDKVKSFVLDHLPRCSSGTEFM